MCGSLLLTEGIIDIHSHILPGVDDGSRSLEESLELLEMAYRQGVRGIIATPHYSRSRDNRHHLPLTEKVRGAFLEKHPDFEIWPGQETFFHEELPERLEEGQALTLAGSRYVLMEMDTGRDYSYILRAVRSLVQYGYRPIMAHIERFPALRDDGRLDELVQAGCLLQMNFDSLKGNFFTRDKWCRAKVLEGRIHVLGSDMHRLDFRPPAVDEAMKWLEKALSEEELLRITRINPLHIIHNEKTE